MKKTIIALALSLPIVAGAQTIGADAGARSDSGAMAQTGAITFEAGVQRGSINTTPSLYTAPAVTSGITCMGSNTASVVATGFGIGGATSVESKPCNDREDTAVMYRIGLIDAARIKFGCFTADENRMAYEAAGGRCPVTATARGSFDATRSRMAGADFNYPNTGGQ